MMILISKADFCRLSPACRQELLALLTSSGQLSQSDLNSYDSSGSGDGRTDLERSAPVTKGIISAHAPLVPVSKTRRNAKKRIVGLSVDQARRLIANVSLRSQNTLKLFVFGDWVRVDALIGPDKDYADLTVLKRSLIGGITRRLRTVTCDRDAVLFVGNSDKSALCLWPVNADALRQALNLPEPPPRLGPDENLNEYQEDEVLLEPDAPL